MTSLSSRFRILLLLGSMALLSGGLSVLSGCMTMGLRSAVDVSFQAAPETPGRALVYVDGVFVGTLAQVMHQGMRLSEGKHRISVEKTGYYPFDVVVVSNRHPIAVEVELLPLPD